MKHLLVYGFNIANIELPDIEELSTYNKVDPVWVIGSIEINLQATSSAEVHADVELENLARTELENGNSWAQYFIHKLGPWILRKAANGLRIPGSVRKSVGGFHIVLMPVFDGDE